MLNGSCNICMEPITNPVLEPNCQNVFCGSCILKWLKTKENCPLCRKDVKANELIIEGSTDNLSCKDNNTKILTKENILSLYVKYFLILLGYILDLVSKNIISEMQVTNNSIQNFKIY